VFIYRILVLDSCLGLAIDYCSKSECKPITHYHFWPKNEAWDLIRLELDSKPWITPQDKMVILNKTSEIFNCWQKGDLKLSVNYDFDNPLSDDVVLVGHI
jgi:30S ribosomal protein 3